MARGPTPTSATPHHLAACSADCACWTHPRIVAAANRAEDAVRDEEERRREKRREEITATFAKGR